MMGWSAETIGKLIERAPEGIVVCEARGSEQPVVYANEFFQQFTGYSSAELVGADLRLLQREDRSQHGRERLRRALQQGGSARALLRNYRKDGTPFVNDVLIEPVRDVSGNVTHYMGYHRDAAVRGIGKEVATAPPAEAAPLTAVADAEPELETAKIVGLPRWLREDRLTGVFTRAWFEELLAHQWALSEREVRVMTLLMFDIKALDLYNNTFGRSAGDTCVRRLANMLTASFRRGSDVVARWDGGTFCVLVQSNDMAATSAYVQGVVQRVAELQIHHPRSPRGRFLTLSAAAARVMPTAGGSAGALVATALQALDDSRTRPKSELVVKGNAEV
jgi:diguanylate cyclase (GGDEF)-like protein/PAS domain S-box-containing protein